MSSRLTAGELGITDNEMEALLWVRDALDPEISDKDLPAWMRFDMSRWIDARVGAEATVCGTVCCIGGSMEVYLSGIMDHALGPVLTVDEYRAIRTPGGGSRIKSQSLDPLFFAYPTLGMPGRAEATAAIDQFLTGNTGDPWMRRSQALPS